MACRLWQTIFVTRLCLFPTPWLIDFLDDALELLMLFISLAFCPVHLCGLFPELRFLTFVWDLVYVYGLDHKLCYWWRTWLFTRVLLFSCRYARCTRSVSIGKLTVNLFKFKMRTLWFKMRNQNKCLICLFCAMQFHLLTMRTWQHSGLVFTWILRHQIVDPVVLCQAKVVGAQLSAPTEEQQVLRSGHFQQWERM